MKTILSRLLCAGFACLVSLPFAAGGAALSPVPVAIAPAPVWKALSVNGGKAELTDEAGILHLKYDVDIQSVHRIAYQTFFEETLLLELKEPMAISPDLARISFEARGQDGSAESRTGTLFIRPVVEDQNGERFSYEPYRVADLKEGKPLEWARWTTRPFRASEAGGASPNIYVASGGDQNAWPDGQLKFVGFEIRVRLTYGGTKKGPRKGDVYITGVRIDPTHFAPEAPAAFADAFLSEKGHYRAMFQVRPAFQANPIEELASEIDYDPASEPSRKQRMAVPSAGKLANSWVRYRFVDAGGKIASEGDLRWENDLSPEAAPVPPQVDVKMPPPVGRVRVNPVKSTEGVYAPGEPLQVTFRVFQPRKSESGAPAKTLKWTLNAYGFPQQFEQGEAVVAPAGAKPFEDVVSRLKTPENHTAFQLDYTLADAAGQEVDRGSYILGIGGRGVAVEPRHSRQGVLPDRNEIKKAPYNRFTFHPGRDVSYQPGKKAAKMNGEEYLRRFSESLDQGRSFSPHVTYSVDPAEFEILPGVFDFSMLDRVMDIAADKWCSLTIRLSHMEKTTPYLWLPVTRPRDFDGEVIGGHPLYKAVSIADKSYREAWVRAFRALYDRYREHPGFEGYYIMLPNGEINVPDEVWHGKIADYCWAAQEEFRSYLRKDLGLSLEQLNQRWGSSYTAWGEILPPEPDWTQGTVPDLRPQWMDFSRFKLKLADLWSPVIAQEIRKFDPRRVVIAYGNPNAFAHAQGGESTVDYAHNGGNHYLQNEGEYIKVWENGKGVGWITEPHHPHRWAAYGDPAQRGWVLDWSVFVMLSQGGGGATNLHYYYYPNPTYNMLAHYGGEYSMDRLEQYKPILRELHGLQVMAPPRQVAVIRDHDTLLAKHRTTSSSRGDDLARWFELLTADSVPWENFTADHEANYKAVFLNPLDEVLGAETIRTVVRLAKNGATVVLAARTGRYCSAAPKSAYPLLAAMDVPPPTGAFDTAAPKVGAEVDPAFQKALGRDKFPFYSQADMRAELQDPAVWAEFYRWPYRWLPQSDYFGHFPGQQPAGGEVLARFADGGVALSRHPVGKGAAIIFWGTPDITPARLKGLVGSLAEMAGVVNPQAGNAIPFMLEGKDPATGRQYALLYQETAGVYTQKLPNAPDGNWFVDDMVSGQRMGTYSGEELRKNGISLTYLQDAPPLKVLRIYRFDGKLWIDKYRKPEEAK